MTSRWSSSINATAAALPSVRFCLMCDLNFGSGSVYVHAGQGELPANGHIYLGLGTFGGFDQIIEDSQVVPRPLTLKLAGVPTELVASAMTEVYQGKTVTLWIGLLADNGQWVAAPEQLWSGVMDTMQIDIGVGSSVISMVCEDPDYARPMGRRFTSADLQFDFPGDKGLEYLPAIPGFLGNWGVAGYGYGFIGNAPGSPTGPVTPQNPAGGGKNFR